MGEISLLDWNMNLKTHLQVAGGANALHYISRTEKGQVVAVTTIHSHSVHQPPEWNSNLQHMIGFYT